MHHLILATLLLAEVAEMTFGHRLMAMGIGGVAALFAISYAPPDSYREGAFRFGAGCLFAFSCTGTTLGTLHMTVGTDNVLMIGLVWGTIGWSVLGGLVQWGKDGGPMKYLARLVQGQIKNDKSGE